MNRQSSILLVHATAQTPGAIAILQLMGKGCERLLVDLTGVRDWPLGRMRLVDLAGIDEGLGVRLRDDCAHLMPHGGPRVVQRLTARLLELGATLASVDDVDPQRLYPEAADRIEALMLLALARAESPLAIDLLLQQPPRWRAAKNAGAKPTDADRARSHLLNRLIAPPRIVLAGEPNVGKSTLSNALLGRAMSITADVPGTTRDYVAGRIDLTGLVVDWHDTPGLRRDADVIERKAIDIARRLMQQADLLIAMRDAEHDWPALPRPADLFVVSKVDDLNDGTMPASGASPADPLRISATTGRGLPAFTRAIRERLVPTAVINDPHPWLFDPRLVDA